MMSNKTHIFFPLFHWKLLHYTDFMCPVLWAPLAECLLCMDFSTLPHFERTQLTTDTAADPFHSSFSDYKCVVFTNNPFLDNKNILTINMQHEGQHRAQTSDREHSELAAWWSLHQVNKSRKEDPFMSLLSGSQIVWKLCFDLAENW